MGQNIGETGIGEIRVGETGTNHFVWDVFCMEHILFSYGTYFVWSVFVFLGRWTVIFHPN